MPCSILIIEDDITFSLMLSTWLTKKKFDVHTTTSIAEAEKKISSGSFNLILSDIRLPDGNGIELLKWAKSKGIDTPFIMMTSYAEIQSAVQSMKLGAADYIAKPVNPDDLLQKINEVCGAAEAKPAPQKRVEQPNNDQSNTYIIGNNAASVLTYEHAGLVGPTDMSVLITGDSGTGKEYVARYLHEHSNRKSAPFVAVDCGAIPKDLAASEFFGHIKGSFTGAIDDKTGAFVAAQGGTIFLDEIGNLSYEVQVQLLRALQERKVKPIGSNKEIAIDVRVISATNENLRNAIQQKDFREDLYHRINEFTIRVPSLAERKEDIMLFANHFLAIANIALKKEVTGFDGEAIRLLEAYPWPGNLRQLKNTVKYAALLATGTQITAKELPEELSGYTEKPDTGTALRNEEQERELIVNALRKADNNKTKAARLLGVDRKTLYNKLKQYGL